MPAKYLLIFTVFVFSGAWAENYLQSTDFSRPACPQPEYGPPNPDSDYCLQDIEENHNRRLREQFEAEKSKNSKITPRAWCEKITAGSNNPKEAIRVCVAALEFSY